jgi:hypothetical protein
MFEKVREANKIINKFRGELEVYNVDWRNDFHALW